MSDDENGLLRQLFGTVQQLLAQGGQIIGRLDGMAKEVSSVRHDHNNMAANVMALSGQVTSLNVRCEGAERRIADLEKQADESAQARAQWHAERAQSGRFWGRMDKWAQVILPLLATGGAAGFFARYLGGH